MRDEGGRDEGRENTHQEDRRHVNMVGQIEEEEVDILTNVKDTKVVHQILQIKKLILKLTGVHHIKQKSCL